MVRWLIMQGSSWQDAVTAVSYAAQRHLDWDMNEQRTFADWKSAVTEGRKRGTDGENSVLAVQGDGSATG